MKSVPFSSVYTGQIFSEPLKFQPPTWLIQTLMPIITFLQPGVCFDLKSSNPYILSPLMSTMQMIQVHEEDSVIPSLTDLLSCTRDELSLIDPLFQNMSISRRKTYFSCRYDKLKVSRNKVSKVYYYYFSKNLEKYSFDPTLVYSFEFYQVTLFSFTTSFYSPILCSQLHDMVFNLQHILNLMTYKVSSPQFLNYLI